MITIDLLKNHVDAVSALANIWYQVLGKIWMPELEIAEIEDLCHQELHQDTAFTYVAFYDEVPVGFCTLQLMEDIRPGLGPWMSDLVVDENYQKRGIGQMLMKVVIEKAKALGFKKLYLFTFDNAIVKYYQRFGWKKMGMDTFKSHSVTVMELRQ